MNQRDAFLNNGTQQRPSPVLSQNSTFSVREIPVSEILSPPPTSSNGTQEEEYIYHGEALARYPQLERYGGWIVFGFTAAFALFLIFMNLAGQAPGRSFVLKSISDILQFVGEGIGLYFAVSITVRLRSASRNLTHTLWRLEQEGNQHHAASELAAARNDVQAAQRAFYAWVLISLGVALYATGQAIWTSYDVRMPSFQVPFPGIYDIGFVGSYPFFLVGTLLLTRRNRAAVGRTRLLLDALAVIGAALALSWFFVLRPSIAGLAQAPNPGAAFLSIYFPTGDLLLVAIGAFLMFSPLSTREQQPVFVRLCLGLFFLAITDSLLGYFSLSPSGFNTGTLQDILWPLSMSFIGLAAIEYPKSVAREQKRAAEAANKGPATPILMSQLSQWSLALQSVAPFILTLGTCAILLTVVPTFGGKSLTFQASLIALTLVLLVSTRQALTLNENNRLRLQQAGELVLSRRELQVKSRQADEAARAEREKQALEQGMQALQSVISRLANGDFSVRAPTSPGPLQTVAISFNLMIDRLNELAQSAERYRQINREIAVLQHGLDRLGQGVAAWSPVYTEPSSRTELRPLFFAMQRLQRLQVSQWDSLLGALQRTLAPLSHARAVLSTSEEDPAGRNGTVAREIDKNMLGWLNPPLEQLEQQIQTLIAQTHGVIARLEGQSPQQVFPTRPNASLFEVEQKRKGVVPHRSASLQSEQTHQNIVDGSFSSSLQRSGPPSPNRYGTGRGYGSTS